MRSIFRFGLVVRILPLSLALATLACGAPPAAEPAQVAATRQAVWVNGDFEASAIGSTPPSGWSVTNYTNNTGVTGSSTAAPSTFAALNLTAGGKTETFVVGGAAETQVDPDLGAGQPFRFPKYGARGVRVNYKDATDSGKDKNANSLKQTMTVTAGDVDPIDGQVHVRFALAPVLENPSHGYTQQPFYFVELANLTRGTKLYQDFNTAGQSGVPWKTTTSVVTGNTTQWTNWQLVDVAPGAGALAIGDQVQLTVIASGCSLGGHFGRVYVDGMGSTVPGIYTWATGPTSAAANSNITYTLYYNNGAAAAASGVRLEMVTPPNTTFQSVTGLANCTAPTVGGTGTISCPVGTLAAGGSGSIQVVVGINSGATGTITNGNYSISALNSSTLLGAKVRTTVIAGTTRVDVAVTTTTSSNSVDWGGAFTYTITLHNYGPNRARPNQLTFADVFPTQLTGVTWTCSRIIFGSNNTSCNGASGSGNINARPYLENGAEIRYVVSGTLIAGSGTSSMTNTATATMTVRPDTNLNNNTSVTTTAIGLGRTLTLTKAGSAASGTITSAPTGVNCGTGCSSATPTFANGAQVVLTATPIAGATFTGWGGDCSGSALTCTLAMSANRAVTATFAARPAAGTATTVQVWTGGGQLARSSTAFAAPLVAYVTDANGTAVSGVTVTFTPPASGASATLSGGGTAVTNAAGLATVTTATANASAGAYNVNATIAGGSGPASFSLTNVGAPASISYLSGGNVSDPNQAPVGSPFLSALAVIVRDSANSPVPGVTVAFTAPGSGARALLSSATGITDSSGVASVTATANTTAGAYNVTATTAGVVPTIVFALQNIASTPAVVFVVSGNPQRTPTGDPFDEALVVGVADVLGNALSGVTVTFTVPAVGNPRATLSSGTATTDASGLASITATASALSGTYSVTASVAGATSAVFTLTNDGARIVDVFSGSPQSATVGSAFTALSALVTDSGDGSPISGATVTFAAPGSGASATLGSATATTNSAGVATVTATANNTAGSYVVTATEPSAGGPASFALTNAAGAPMNIVVTSGSNQHTLVGSDFPLALTVTVRDTNGNLVSGANVIFAAPGSGASALVSGSPATTDANGQAFVTVVAGATIGSYNVSASVGAVPAVQFALTNDQCTVAADCSIANATAGCSANVCTIASCNAGFTNCDGLVATGCELQTGGSDLSNCGGCGTVCTRANAAPMCTSGSCAIGSCNPGFGNCDGNDANGCEVNLQTSAANCNACGTACAFANAGAACVAGSCDLTTCSLGFGDCDANDANGCEVNLQTSAANCNACGTACTFANAGAACVAGGCDLTTCDVGFGDCDDNDANGCEVNLQISAANCNACGTACTFANAGAACVAGGCDLTTCNPGFGDCDDNDANGCEVNLQTSAANCNACGTACTFANGGAACVAGSCDLTTCVAGFDNCDTNAANGCEVNLQTDAANCNGCGTICSFAHAGAVCVAGACDLTTCDAGYEDCDDNDANGCEVQPNGSDLNNCGACGAVCTVPSGTPVCNSGTCAVDVCSPGFRDCDNNSANGCEVETGGSDANNCGGCGTVCTFAHAGAACVAGSCDLTTCDLGYADCDDSDANGCEIDLRTDSANCDACGTVCTFAQAGAACVAGSCGLTSCDLGFADCDDSDASGCEVDLQTDAANCDACGAVCNVAHAVASCTAGSCGIATCDAGYADCDANSANGCELLTGGTDANNCGGCGVVCDAADYCVAGSCVDRKANDVVCSAPAECSSGICFTDDKCGSPDGEACSTASTCRGGACSASGVCIDAGACAVDDDCTSGEFCDTSLGQCADKLANGVALPTIAGHAPELTGACTDDAALAVCVSGVCDATDSKCGFANDHGACDGFNAASVCRSGVCGSDNRCGYPDGQGSCTSASAALVCRSGVCGVLSQLCADEVGCALDSDCTSSQLCDTGAADCAPKLANGTALPTIANHDPVLNGSCTAAAGSAACSSGVCDAGDDKCGYTNGNGTCDQTTAPSVCRSGVCSEDGKCGYDDGEGRCTSVDAGAVCRSGVCSVSNVCMPTGGCAVDGDCTSSQFCNTATAMCTAKLDNGTAIPNIAAHAPALVGTCSTAVGVAVCKAGVCDVGDDKCGYRNDEGSCTSANAGSVCRSGACGSDGQCGFLDGEGACTGMNAAVVCRGALCDAETKRCGVPAGCSADADCSDEQFCNNESGDCVAKLADGVMVPVIDGHEPELSGQCSQSVGAAVCKAGVCDERDDRCGYANDGGSCDAATASTVCRSGVCGGDDACGYPDGEGPCTSQDADIVCRSGECSAELCGPAVGCSDDDDCTAAQFCDVGAHECKKKKADGQSCADDNQCRSDSCNADSKRCNTCIDETCGELKISGGGCRTSTGGTGDDGSWLLALSALALGWRARRRTRAWS